MPYGYKKFDIDSVEEIPFHDEEDNSSELIPKDLIKLSTKLLAQTKPGDISNNE